MPTTLESPAGWIPRNPLHETDGLVCAVDVDGLTLVLEAIPAWNDATGTLHVPKLDTRVLDLVSELSGDGPWALTDVPYWPTKALLLGRTLPFLEAPQPTQRSTSRTAGWEDAGRGRRRTPVEMNRTPMWLFNIPEGDPVRESLSDGSATAIDADEAIECLFGYDEGDLYVLVPTAIAP